MESNWKLYQGVRSNQSDAPSCPAMSSPPVSRSLGIISFMESLTLQRDLRSFSQIQDSAGGEPQ